MTKEQLYERYFKLCHAIQSGIAFLMEYKPSIAEPKHLRVGLDCRAIDHGALVALLLEKSVFTEEEYAAKLVEWAAREVQSNEAALTKILGKKVTLQ